MFFTDHGTAVLVVLTLLLCSALIIREVRSRRQQQERDKKHNEELDEKTTTITQLQTTADKLTTDLHAQDAIITAKENELAAKTAHITTLENTITEKHKQLEALKQHQRPNDPARSPLGGLYGDARSNILPLLNAARGCLADSIAQRIAEAHPDSIIRPGELNDKGTDILTYAVIKPTHNIGNEAKAWIETGDKEHKNLTDLEEQANKFVEKVDKIYKIYVKTGHIEEISMAECAEVAKDFSKLIMTGGLNLLRILSGVSQSLKMEKLERKIDLIILMLNAEQIAEFDSVYLAAGEQYLHSTIDERVFTDLRHRLLKLECRLLQELRGLLATAPDVNAFRLKWGQM